MPLRPTAVVIALVALAIALWLLIAAARRRRWTSIFRVVPALCLLGLVAVLVPYIFGLSGPHPFFNHPAPVAADTIVYYRSGPTPFDGRTTLYAVAGRTGKTLWQFQIPGTDAFMTQSGDTVFAVSLQGEPSPMFQVVAIHGATGAVLWTDTLASVVTAGAPVLAGGTLFLGVTAADPQRFQQLFAIRPSDGQQLWSVRIGSASGNTPFLFATTNALFVRPDSETLQARRVTDGGLLWADAHVDGQIVTGPGAVYALSENGSVVTLDAQTGAELWRFGDHDVFHVGVVAGNTVYVTGQGSGSVTDATGKLSNPETVYALDAASGHARWSFATGSSNGGQLVVGPDAVYVVGDDGIHALRAADGTVIWQTDSYSNGGFAEFAPVGRSVLYVLGLEMFPPETLSFTFFGPPPKGQAYLYALNISNGTADWGMPVGPVVTIYPHYVI